MEKVKRLPRSSYPNPGLRDEDRSGFRHPGRHCLHQSAHQSSPHQHILRRHVQSTTQTGGGGALSSSLLAAKIPKLFQQHSRTGGDGSSSRGISPPRQLVARHESETSAEVCMPHRNTGGVGRVLSILQVRHTSLKKHTGDSTDLGRIGVTAVLAFLSPSVRLLFAFRFWTGQGFEVRKKHKRSRLEESGTDIRPDRIYVYKPLSRGADATRLGHHCRLLHPLSCTKQEKANGTR